MPWGFPLRHVLWRAPSQRRGPERPIGFCRTPPPRHAMLASAMVLVSTAIAYPTPRHTRRSASHRVRPALRRGSELTGAFPADVDAANAVKRVCAGHRPATSEPDDRQNMDSLDTPTGYVTRASDRRFRWSEALSRTRWQVKDSNLRSFRDGFTVLGRQGCDQQKCLSTRQLTCVFPTNSRRQPGPTGHFWACTRSRWSRWRPGSAS